MKTITLQYLKSIALSIIYLTLSINVLFFSPHKVPPLEELQRVEIAGDGIACVKSVKKNPKYTKIQGTFDEKEIKSYEMGTERCLQIFDITPYFIRLSPQPDSYTVYLAEDKARIFGEGYTIYQIEANGKILLPYKESAEAIQKQLDLFLYISIGFFSLMGVLLVVNLKKWLSEPPTQKVIQ
ncbi:hypothetical protein [Algivirga pacifica]|uniref:Uncharacterized protein n=1 Tax=Algivirga pacifica TaxID=1162670 RepID=A0ABP9DKE3_9BACT